MKWLLILLVVQSLSACAGMQDKGERSVPAMDPAQIGIVNHTGSYIYSASVNGVGGGI